MAEVDREKTCPHLLRVFVKSGQRNRAEDYVNLDQQIKDKRLEEICIHTWKDATLRELTDLIKEVNVEAQAGNAKLVFSLVYPNQRGLLRMQEIGACFSNPKRATDTASKTLEELKFQIGDFLDVWIVRIQARPQQRSGPARPTLRMDMR